MKKIVSLILCFLGVITYHAVSYAKNSQSLDHIVAVVNEEVIVQSELKKALQRIQRQINQEHQPKLAPHVLEKQVLDQLINKTLQLQLAQQAGIQIREHEINEIIARIASQNHLSPTELYQRINEEGLSTAEYRQEIQDQITIQRLQQQEIASKLTITPEEINNFIQSNAWQDNSNNEYHLEDILIALPDHPTPEQITQAKTRAQVIRTELQLHQGKNFHKIAQKESGSSNALNGGDLGWRKLPEIPTAFTEQVVHMQVNDISAPIQTPNGFHIIRLANVRHLANRAAPNRKQIEDLLLQQKLETAVQHWVSKLRANAFISTPAMHA